MRMHRWVWSVSPESYAMPFVCRACGVRWSLSLASIWCPCWKMRLPRQKEDREP